MFLVVTIACADRDHVRRALVAFPLQAVCSTWLLVHAIVWVRRGPLGWLSSRPMSAVGRISYSIYLWQLAGIGLVRTVWSHLPPAAMVAASWATVLGIAGLSYMLIERPALRYGRRFRRP